MLSTFKKLGLLASPSVDLSVFSGINDGVDGATDVIISGEPFAPLKIEANQTAINGYDFSINLRTLRDANATESDLVSYASAESTDALELAILGLGASLVSVAGWKFVFVDKMSTNTYEEFMITRREIGLGYNASGVKLSGLHFGHNLLALYEVDAFISSNLAGFTTSDDMTVVNTNPGEVEVTNNEAFTAFYRSQNIFFPFAGETLTASLELSDSDDATNALGIAFFDSDGVAITSTSTAMGLTTGRKSHSAVAPADTAYARMFVAVIASKLVTFSEPALRTDNSTEFTML